MLHGARVPSDALKTSNYGVDASRRHHHVVRSDRAEQREFPAGSGPSRFCCQSCLGASLPILRHEPRLLFRRKTDLTARPEQRLVLMGFRGDRRLHRPLSPPAGALGSLWLATAFMSERKAFCHPGVQSAGFMRPMKGEKPPAMACAGSIAYFRKCKDRSGRHKFCDVPRRVRIKCPGGKTTTPDSGPPLTSQLPAGRNARPASSTSIRKQGLTAPDQITRPIRLPTHRESAPLTTGSGAASTVRDREAARDMPGSRFQCRAMPMGKRRHPRHPKRGPKRLTRMSVNDCAWRTSFFCCQGQRITRSPWRAVDASPRAGS